MYIEGQGLPKSSAAAAVWLERACVADEPVACRLLGVMLVQGVGVAQNLERGKQLLARACNAKDDEACRLSQPASGSQAATLGLPEGSGRGSAGGPTDAHL
jgi:TPR repeat protein